MTFLVEINSDDAGISKLVSQLKLLRTLYELGTIDMQQLPQLILEPLLKNCKIYQEIDAL